MSGQKARRRPNDAYIRRCELRRRRAQEILAEFIDKSLPAMPAVPGIPGWTRLLRSITNIEIQMTMIAKEMESYRQHRSKEWKGDMRGYLFDKKIEGLRRITDDVAAWPDLNPDGSAEADEEQHDRLSAYLNRDVTHHETREAGDASA
jgi:hypothetical protein